MRQIPIKRQTPNKRDMKRVSERHTERQRQNSRRVSERQRQRLVSCKGSEDDSLLESKCTSKPADCNFAPKLQAQPITKFFQNINTQGHRVNQISSPNHDSQQEEKNL